MTEPLSQIHGRAVISVEFRDDDEIFVSLTDGWALSIYNAASICNLGECQRLDSPLLVGATIVSHVLDHERLVMYLDNEISLHVDLRDEAYRGPEAFVVRAPNVFIVV